MEILGGTPCKRVSRISQLYPSRLGEMDFVSSPYSIGWARIPPPEQLYYKGTLLSEDGDGILVVGSRRATEAGLAAAFSLAAQVSKDGLTIISGCASGIDGKAHEGALAARGRTIAVMPRSLDKVYPPEHLNLAERIISVDGALVSEYPPGSTIFNPKARNRIMLGMSRIVVVIEGAERSGTLATARLAYHLKIPILVLDKSEINGPTGYLADWARSHQDPMVQTFSMADQVLDKYGVS